MQQIREARRAESAADKREAILRAARLAGPRMVTLSGHDLEAAITGELPVNPQPEPTPEPEEAPVDPPADPDAAGDIGRLSLPQSTVGHLTEAGIETVADLESFIAQGKSLVDLKGIGEATAVQISASLAALE